MGIPFALVVLIGGVLLLVDTLLVVAFCQAAARGNERTRPPAGLYSAALSSIWLNTRGVQNLQRRATLPRHAEGATQAEQHDENRLTTAMRSEGEGTEG